MTCSCAYGFPNTPLWAVSYRNLSGQHCGGTSIHFWGNEPRHWLASLQRLVDRRNNLSIDQCKAECAERESQCAGFAYRSSDGECLWQTGPLAPAASPGYDCYQRLHHKHIPELCWNQMDRGSRVLCMRHLDDCELFCWRWGRHCMRRHDHAIHSCQLAFSMENPTLRMPCAPRSSFYAYTETMGNLSYRDVLALRQNASSHRYR